MHTVSVRLTNAATQNLYLDKVAFESTATPTPTLSPKPSPRPSPSPKPSPTLTPSPGPGERSISSAYTTGYTWFDNTPPGSAQISHPVLHASAGGTGTYADPITVAVGHSLATGRDILDYPAGTRFYVPHVSRYFIVEDTCGNGPTPQNVPCHRLAGAPAGATTWIDFYLGGGPGDTEKDVSACASKITDADRPLHQVIVNPRAGYPVVPGPLFQAGRCTRLY